MTPEEKKTIQDRLSYKMEHHPDEQYYSTSSKFWEGYKRGILVAKSVIHSIMPDESSLDRMANEKYNDVFEPDEEKVMNDKKLFVHNLGVLLSQTRYGIHSCELIAFDVVRIAYDSGEIRDERIIHNNEYLGIMFDVIWRLF